MLLSLFLLLLLVFFLLLLLFFSNLKIKILFSFTLICIGCKYLSYGNFCIFSSYLRLKLKVLGNTVSLITWLLFSFRLGLVLLLGYLMSHCKSRSLTKGGYDRFKLVSLNVRGLRSINKRRALFMWLTKQKADIVFLQETYSSIEDEKFWNTQWKGKMLFSHGSHHSKGTMVLIKQGLDF